MLEREGTNPAPHRIGPRLVWMVAGFVATFVAVDRLIATVHLPDTIHNSGSPVRLLAEYAQQASTADVAFLGCSYSSFGIDPDVVDAEAHRLGADITSYNFAFGGALTLANTRLCELLLNSERLPRVIYYEVSPGMLNRRVPSLRYAVGQIGGLREAAVLWSVSPKDRANAVLSQTMAGFHQWNTIRMLVECAREGAPVFRPKVLRGTHGHLVWTGGTDGRDARVARMIAERESYWGDYVIDDYALDAVLRVERLARARGIQVRYFEMPMSNAWQSIIRDDVRKAYAAALATLQAAGCAEPWRCPPGLVEESDFFDADHLLPTGAEKVSRAIAADVVRYFPHAAATPTAD